MITVTEAEAREIWKFFTAGIGDRGKDYEPECRPPLEAGKGEEIDFAWELPGETQFH